MNKTLFFYAPNLSYVKKVKSKNSHQKGIQDGEKITDSLENLIEKNKDVHTVIIFSFPSPNIFYTESDAVVNFRLDNSMKNLFEETLFELIAYGREDLFEGELFNLLISKENPNRANYTPPAELRLKAESKPFTRVCNEIYTLLSDSRFSFLDFMKYPDHYEKVIHKDLPDTAAYSKIEVETKLIKAGSWIYQRMVNLAFPFKIPSDAKLEINSKKYFSILTVDSTEEFDKLNNYDKISVVKQKQQNRNNDKMYIVANSLV